MLKLDDRNLKTTGASLGLVINHKAPLPENGIERFFLTRDPLFVLSVPPWLFHAVNTP